jgi:hypothetical protein
MMWRREYAQACEDRLVRNIAGGIMIGMPLSPWWDDSHLWLQLPDTTGYHFPAGVIECKSAIRQAGIFASGQFQDFRCSRRFLGPNFGRALGAQFPARQVENARLVSQVSHAYQQPAAGDFDVVRVGSNSQNINNTHASAL